MIKKKIVFIVNPKAGTQKIQEIEEAIQAYLDLEKFSFEIVFTTHKGHGSEIAKEAVESDVDLIVSVGGDGSLHDVAQEVVGTDLPVAVWPLGSGNGLARSLGIPFKAKDVLDLINQFHIIDMDVGEVNGHYFVATFGLGFDAEISKLFEGSKMRGFWSYFLLIIKRLPSFKPLHVKAKNQGELIHDGQAFILNAANVPQLGYGFEIAPLADWQDGKFDLMVIEPVPFWRMPFIALKAFSKRLHTSKKVQRYVVEEFMIKCDHLHGYQMDGEYVSSSELSSEWVEIKIRPKGIKLLVG